MTTLAEIAAAAAPFGLAAAGFHPGPEDGAPAGTRTLVLLGYDGPAMWAAFSTAPEAADGRPDPLDRWSRRVVGGLAARFGAAAILPSDGPPYPPFLAWARAAEPVWTSPLGMLIHAKKGLWVSYRGALALPERLELPARAAAVRPCDGCEGRPCLAACPVGAFGANGYDVEACAGWIGAPAGADCLGRGCLARRACPVGAEFRHGPEQAGHHMRAFLAARRGA